ncbi:MAG: phosphatidate cytidylyltransferase [Geodermatophilaceae bacterium]|jgi:phosphatidate cytidylyltransferase|nr:phosphatidate cytidylyltransferase [Geodermatophilaceae bacterium]
MEPITLATSALLVGGVATRVTRNTEVRARFRTWLAAAPVVLIPLILLGPWGAVALASVLGVIAATEYARLSCLRRVDALLLAMVVGLLPVGILVNPLLTLATVSLALPLGSAIAPVLHGDSFEGARRSAATCFGIVWLGGGLAGIGLLEPAVAAAVCIAVAVADVGAWCGGRWLGRSGPLSKGLSSLSPSKTWAGVLGAAIAGTGVLALLGQLTPGLAIAVVVGGVLGDLVESMVKRCARCKDAGTWLPGFGGLLDRIDSLLIALPLCLILTGALA